MPEQQYTANSIIFSEGDDASEAYIIRSGEVEILKHAEHGEVRLATLAAGEVFGEMALFEAQGKRSATARSTQATIVDIVTKDEFNKLIEQCPDRILPILHTILQRLRSSNERISESEAASVVLDSDINKITVTADSQATNFDDIEVAMARLPFIIGGYGEEGQNKKNKHNQLNILCDGPPLTVSRQHCQIEIIDKGVYLTDLGSRFTTIVNGVNIGRGKGKYRVPLQKGENDVTLGGINSPYKIKIICE